MVGELGKAILHQVEAQLVQAGQDEAQAREGARRVLEAVAAAGGGRNLYLGHRMPWKVEEERLAIVQAWRLGTPERELAGRFKVSLSKVRLAIRGRKNTNPSGSCAA